MHHSHHLTRHYLIQTAHSPHPYHSNVPFIASDYTRWGHRVDSYAPGSLWVHEHQKRMRKEKWRRPRLVLLWAAEVLKRDAAGGESAAAGAAVAQGEEERTDRLGRVLKDFMRGLKRADKPGYKYRIDPTDHGFEDCNKAVAFYARCMSLTLILRAPMPRLALFNEDERVDCLTLKFPTHPDRRKEHLHAAMKFVVEAEPERMGELKVDGRILVRFWVKAVDRRRGGDEDVEEQLPLYESEEEGDLGELPPPYEEVVDNLAND